MKRIIDLARKLREERGITGLETAIVLIAFVVVAAVFAFVVLSTGLFSSERGKETVYAGLAKTRGSMELTGGVIASSNTTELTAITFDLTLAAGGDQV
ncbi:MAG: flagellin, partial [Chloroflexi bacterium]|nr:flagellin [Chloroflexota bacterium]